MAFYFPDISFAVILWRAYVFVCNAAHVIQPTLRIAYTIRNTQALAMRANEVSIEIVLGINVNTRTEDSFYFRITKPPTFRSVAVL